MEQKIEPGRTYWVLLPGIERRVHVKVVGPGSDPKTWLCESVSNGARIELPESANWQPDK